MSADTVLVHICTTEDLHPYECGGKCIHCRAEHTKYHNPRRCWFCWDGDPKGLPGAATSYPPALVQREKAIALALKRAWVQFRDLDYAGRANVLGGLLRFHENGDAPSKHRTER